MVGLFNGIKISWHRNWPLMLFFFSLPFKANYFSKISKAPVICKVVGRKVLDGVGQPTLEVEIHCTVINHEKVWAACPNDCIVFKMIPLITKYTCKADLSREFCLSGYNLGQETWQTSVITKVWDIRKKVLDEKNTLSGAIDLKKGTCRVGKDTYFLIFQMTFQCWKLSSILTWFTFLSRGFLLL